MPTYEIRHTWKESETPTVVAKVEGAVALARSGRVPAGFRPVAIVSVPNAPEAHCLWEAPSAAALEEMYRGFALPTQRTIREVTPFFAR